MNAVRIIDVETVLPTPATAWEADLVDGSVS